MLNGDLLLKTNNTYSLLKPSYHELSSIYTEVRLPIAHRGRIKTITECYLCIFGQHIFALVGYCNVAGPC